MGYSILRSLFSAFLLLGSTKAQTAYESLYTVDDFSLQQGCVQGCFMTTMAVQCSTDILGRAIGCPNEACSRTWAAPDGCYCRGDLQPAAHQWLSQCIDEECTVGNNALNLANAISIYSGYCSERGFTAQPADNTAETTSPGGNPTATTANTLPGAELSGPTGSADTSPPASPSTNKTLMSALVAVSVVAVIAIAIAVFFFWRSRRNQPPVNPELPLSKLATQPPSAQNASQVFEWAAAIAPTPQESASQVGTARMGDDYPHRPVAPSALSSNRPGRGLSTIGPGRH